MSDTFSTGCREVKVLCSYCFGTIFAGNIYIIIPAVDFLGAFVK